MFKNLNKESLKKVMEKMDKINEQVGEKIEAKVKEDKKLVSSVIISVSLVAVVLFLFAVSTLSFKHYLGLAILVGIVSSSSLMKMLPKKEKVEEVEMKEEAKEESQEEAKDESQEEAKDESQEEAKE